MDRSAGPFMMPAASGAKRNALALGLLFLLLIEPGLAPRAFLTLDLTVIDFMAEKRDQAEGGRPQLIEYLEGVRPKGSVVGW